MSASPRATILNVGDGAAERCALTEVLCKAGFSVQEAATAEEGVRLLPEGPDLIIVNIGVGDPDGPALYRRLKADPATSSVPVLLVSSGFYSDEDLVSGLEGGADAYLAYPVSPPELVAIVTALLRVRRAEEAEREKASQLEQAQRHKDQFLAMLAHELRNPLTAILATAQILRQSGAEAGRRAWVAGALERQTGHLTRLVGDLLDLSRIEQGKVLLRQERLSTWAGSYRPCSRTSVPRSRRPAYPCTWS